MCFVSCALQQLKSTAAVAASASAAAVLAAAATAIAAAAAAAVFAVAALDAASAAAAAVDSASSHCYCLARQQCCVHLCCRHGQSFLDHLDSEHAEAEAEEIYEAQNNARKAAEQHLRKQQAPAGAFTPRRPSDATGAAAASGSPSKSELEQQQRQQQQQQQQQAPTPALHKQQQQRQQQKHQQQQEQQPIQALHQPSRQREPVHSFASTPASSHGASGNSETSAPAPAGLTSGPSNSFNSTPNVLHAPSSTAVAAAKGLSVAGRLEADKAAGQSQRSQPSSLSHESTASNLAEDEAVFVHDSTVRESAPDSVDEASVPASASATSMTDSLDESPSDTASIAVDTEAADAAAVGDRAVPADGPTEDPADDLVTDVADDPVARECPWVDSELLFFVTDDEGYPLNTVLPTDEEAGIQQQQCFLAYEVSPPPHQHSDHQHSMCPRTCQPLNLPAGGKQGSFGFRCHAFVDQPV